MKIVGGKWSNWSGGVICKPRKIVTPKDEVELAAAVRQAEGPGARARHRPFLHAAERDRRHADRPCGLHGSQERRCRDADGDAFGRDAAVGDRPAAASAGLRPQEHGRHRPPDAGRRRRHRHARHGPRRWAVSPPRSQASACCSRAARSCNARRPRIADIFAAGRTSLGALGVMTEITMNVRPAYKLVENNFLLPIDELFRRLDELVADNRHFEFFWFPYADVAVCKIAERNRPAGARAALGRADARARREGRRRSRAPSARSTRCCPMRRSC